MKKKLFTILMFFTVVFLFASDWEISKVSEGIYEGYRSDGKSLFIVMEENSSEAVLDKITNCIDTVWSIPNIEGTKASVNVESDSNFRFIIYPSKLIYEDVDYAKNLPSGMAFYYNYSLFYDVSLKVEDLMPRITGAYISPEDLLAQIKSATQSPDLFMYDEYVLQRLDRLENAVMALSKKGIFAKATNVDPEIVLAVRSLYNENPDLTQKQILSILKEQGMKVSASDVAAVRLVYLGIIE